MEEEEEDLTVEEFVRLSKALQIKTGLKVQVGASLHAEVVTVKPKTHLEVCKLDYETRPKFKIECLRVP